MGVKVKGIPQVVMKLNKFVKNTDKKAIRAIYMALDVVAADAALMTPIDTSNLVNSQFKDVDLSGVRITGKIGYSAAYALYVHNASGKLKGKPRAHFGKTSNRSAVGPQKPKEFGGGTGQGNYWDPGGEPQFLVKAMNNNKEIIKDIFSKELKP